MEWSIGLIIIICAFVIFIIAMVIMFLKFRRLGRRLKTKVNIINKDRTSTTLWLKDVKESFNNGEDKYMFDSKAIIKRRYYDEIFYYAGNPKPIFFDTELHKVEITSKNLKAYIENELIVQLFKGSLYSTENILILISIILGAVGVLLLANIQFSGVTLADNEANKVLIEGVIKGLIAR